MTGIDLNDIICLIDQAVSPAAAESKDEALEYLRSVQSFVGDKITEVEEGPDLYTPDS